MVSLGQLARRRRPSCCCSRRPSLRASPTGRRPLVWRPSALLPLPFIRRVPCQPPHSPRARVARQYVPIPTHASTAGRSAARIWTPCSAADSSSRASPRLPERAGRPSRSGPCTWPCPLPTRMAQVCMRAHVCPGVMLRCGVCQGLIEVHRGSVYCHRGKLLPEAPATNGRGPVRSDCAVTCRRSARPHPYCQRHRCTSLACCCRNAAPPTRSTSFHRHHHHRLHCRCLPR
jgi:hypothetical protein